MEIYNFSIVTVCLNAQNTIKDTIESVLNQNFINFEYIIKDGNSNDDTNIIINSYKDKFLAKGIKFLHIIENDNGIYDAMNRAVSYCNGNWINFMNAGDLFYNNLVLNDIYRQNIDLKYDVLYGHTLFKYSNDFCYIANHDIKDLENRWSLCHQSTFIKKDIIKKYLFNCDYKIIADYDQFLRIKRDNKLFIKLNVIFSEVDKNGFSNKNTKLLYYENNLLKERYLLKNKKHKHIFFVFIKKYIKILVPSLDILITVRNQMKIARRYK